MSRLHLLNSGPGDPAWNMAVDESLLTSAARRGTPVLRFYGWTEPAATFGYFQHHAEIETRTPLRPLIRRPTGGGIVPHDRDWTYSLAIPPGHPWYELRALESYRTMHAWVVRALHLVRVPADLAPCCRKDIPGACFEGYEQYDVLAFGRKIAGAAQRRNRHGLLVQGSVQPPTHAPRPAWEQAMLAQAPDAFFQGCESWTLDDALGAEARTLVESKYGNPEYNRKR